MRITWYLANRCHLAVNVGDTRNLVQGLHMNPEFVLYKDTDAYYEIHGIWCRNFTRTLRSCCTKTLMRITWYLANRCHLAVNVGDTRNLVQETLMRITWCLANRCHLAVNVGDKQCSSVDGALQPTFKHGPLVRPVPSKHAPLLTALAVPARLCSVTFAGQVVVTPEHVSCILLLSVGSQHDVALQGYVYGKF
ncbi:hypothetical protein J6590_014197 [Homalodisca vitripennis]|nr:hypothetical protein J6590_014197 [Homalodisca vitripennis]